MTWTGPTRWNLIAWGFSMVLWAVLFAVFGAILLGAALQAGTVLGNNPTDTLTVWGLFVAAGAMAFWSGRKYFFMRHELAVLGTA